MNRAISTDKAPKAIGPYSQAVQIGQFIYTSGQIPINPDTGLMIEGGIEEQATQVLNNLKAILTAAGSSMGDVVKTTVFLTDMADFTKMNAVYGQFFTENLPARSAVQVAKLPKDSMIEIEVVACTKQ